MRLYKRTYGLRQICNIAVYFLHSACTLHLLNLPEKSAKRDIVHGLKHLEEIAEDWLCARRTLSILSALARKWVVELPEEAIVVLARTDSRFGYFSTADVPESRSPSRSPKAVHKRPIAAHQSGIAERFTAPSPSMEVAMAKSNQANHLTAASQEPKSNGAMAMPADSTVSTMNSYEPATSQDFTNPEPLTPLQTAQSTYVPGQASPSNMFGGIEAFAETQDWWLRDQASLALGFDNWDGIPAPVDDAGNIDNGYFIPGSRNGELGNEEWFS